MILQQDERIEDLQCDGLKIIQNKRLYTFTSDSVVLANYIHTSKNDCVVEIGAGCGVISILVQAKNNLKKITAFEIQQEMANLCNKNIELNNLQDKIVLINDKIQNSDKYIKPASVDVVFSNPPYFKLTNFNQNAVKQNAKEEILLPLQELVKTSARMLKDGGKFYCCYGAERSIELLCECQKQNLFVKEMFYTENGRGEVKIVVIKAVKNGKNGVKVLPNLVTNEENGNYIEKLKTKNFK